MRTATRGARKASAAAFVGTTIEWYDFFAYSTAAGLVFGHVFFPESEHSSMLGVLAALSTYAVGFLTRPLGGLVLGRLADRVGRRRTLVLTLLLMGVATFLIGCLPTYDDIGWLATGLLVALRLVQGFAVGGEWGGAAVLSVEHAPPERRKFYGSFTQLGSPAGALLSSGIFSLVALGGDEALRAWTWRIPFWISLVLVAVGLVVRLRVDESPAFEEHRAATGADGGTTPPLRTVLVEHRATIGIAIGSLALATGGYYIIVTLLLGYGTDTLGLSSSFLLTGLTLAAAAEVVTLPLAGLAADRWGTARVVHVGVAVSILTVGPLFSLLGSGNLLVVYGLMIVMRCVGQSCAYGPMAGFLSELFPVACRATGASFSYQVAGMVFGGFAPMIGALLLALDDGEPRGLIAFFVALSLLSSAAMVVHGRRQRTPVRQAPLP
ncbi:MFS transporter [Pimelobacter simplex]|uniref:Metabolite transporter, MFS superfamily n=1 Tax=Nocardioides simplex TaxID=2045 RepID=A0A0C5XLY6_NOCSI|nr:MFS transporter [Pimelobacter simplex]AJR18432.1 metabolite transporter, MFS superfamily [Pimelobacter simplex]MCG8149948.1 MFS transporter [Pimelobacter simplex]GEB13842.1 MFS transporter [Pimelobacter simplex]SFM67591.1 Sugar phosphate permease [Pimelobacter simplex]